MKWIWVGLAAACFVAACESEQALDPDQPFAPAGVPTGEDAVDGLIVGHRLMAAGEPELALKAYLRAGAERGLNADVLSALGSANLALGRLGQSETLLRRAIKEDEKFAAAWNNLGVVLMETGQVPEASRVFKTAFALDNGESEQIRNNYTLALANLGDPNYSPSNNENFALVRRGNGRFELLSSPQAGSEQ